MKQQAAKRTAKQRALAVDPLLVDEQEPDGLRGGNDTPATAQPIAAFGSAAGERPAARILGTLAPGVDVEEIDAAPEDNGSIPLSGETELTGGGGSTTTEATIGDGPHGKAGGDGTGDFDFYAVRDATAGQRLLVDIETPTGNLDSVVVLYDATGTPIAANDDSATSLDSLLTLVLPADGDYFVSVTGFNTMQRQLGAGVQVNVLNSRDHADPFGQPDVSRLIVGGTIGESGIETIGIAQSIDPGNFETEETALILLDVVPGPSDDSESFNAYIAPSSDRVRFVGTALGNIASHEAGHYLGSFHVDQYNDVLNLMDQGGNFPLLYGVGPDGVGGTADDPDVDFAEDLLNPDEGFTGSRTRRRARAGRYSHRGAQRRGVNRSAAAAPASSAPPTRPSRRP